MNLLHAYFRGGRKRLLEKVGENYSAWPRGAVTVGVPLAYALIERTNKTKKEALERAQLIKAPTNLAEKVAFKLGYFLKREQGITVIYKDNKATNLPITRYWAVE